MTILCDPPAMERINVYKDDRSKLISSLRKEMAAHRCFTSARGEGKFPSSDRGKVICKDRSGICFMFIWTDIFEELS